MAELSSEIIRLLRRKADPEEHRAIRKLWIDHSVAEDARDIPGLMATLTEDCLYTIDAYLFFASSWQVKLQ